VHNLLFSSLLSKQTKINTYNAIIFLIVLYGGKTLSLTLREEHSLGCFGGENWGKLSLGRPRCIWEDGIMMDIQAVEWVGGHGLD